jgi:hypothetical protein
MPAAPGNLSLAVGDGTRRMSYAELATALPAKQDARRLRWALRRRCIGAVLSYQLSGRNYQAERVRQSAYPEWHGLAPFPRLFKESDSAYRPRSVLLLTF